VKITTNLGVIVAQLFPKEAPVSTANFLAYVKEGFYDGTIFHRVIAGFIVQGGGMDAQMRRKTNQKAPIKNEADNGLKNQRGTLAMARTTEVNSATSQFFINLKNNVFLDHGARDFGYAVFGKIVKGMSVVD
jgi:peptidyl-prolyl cis-trans isomerase A (cyclophilin A)